MKMAVDWRSSKCQLYYCVVLHCGRKARAALACALQATCIYVQSMALSVCMESSGLSREVVVIRSGVRPRGYHRILITAIRDNMWDCRLYVRSWCHHQKCFISGDPGLLPSQSNSSLLGLLKQPYQIFLPNSSSFLTRHPSHHANWHSLCQKCTPKGIFRFHHIHVRIGHFVMLVS